MISPNSFCSLFLSIGESISPARDLVAQSHVPSKIARSASWYSTSSTHTETKQTTSRTRLLSSVNETPYPQYKDKRRSRELPPLPEGEHDVAARSRIRHKAERRRSRSTQKRHDINPTQSLRSSRTRDSSISSTQRPSLNSFQSPSETTKEKNRRSAPAPVSIASLETLSRLKQTNRRSSPLPLRLPVIPASPSGPIFRDPWLEDTYRELTGINQPRDITDGLISPKTKIPRPALLSRVSAKSAPTTSVCNLTVARSPHDISNVPMSASKHAWGVFIDERGPLLLHFLNVLRRPSTGYTLDTPAPTPTTFAQADIARQLESRGWDEGMRGKRTFSESGYWVSA